MDNGRGKVLTDGYLFYDRIEGQYYRCRACHLKTSARSIEEMIHYHRCTGREGAKQNDTGGSDDI